MDFFEDEMVHLGYDWKEVVAEYLFTGKEPMFDSIMACRMFQCPSRKLGAWLWTC